MATSSLSFRGISRIVRVPSFLLYSSAISFCVVTIPCFANEISLPYTTSFESADGIVSGPLSAQANWSSNNGVLVTTALAHWGRQSIVLPASSSPLRASLSFGAAPDASVVFADFYALPTASNTPEAFVEVEGARMAFVQAGVGRAELYLFNGDGQGGGIWEGTGSFLPVDGNHQSATWLRLTVREDFSLKRWSLYLDSELVAGDKGLIDATKAGVSRLTLISQKAGASAFDDLLVGFDNPLFVDNNNNGVEDMREAARGLRSDDNHSLSRLASQPDTADPVDPADPDLPAPLPPPIETKPRPIVSNDYLRLQIYLPLRR